MNKKSNDNYIHICGGKQIRYLEHTINLTAMNYTSEEIRDIYSFYLEQAPIVKQSPSTSLFGLKKLSDYGWKGNGDMSQLERRLLTAGHLSRFIMIKAEKIDNTLKKMNLSGTSTICVEHPRAVLRQNYKVTLNEDGSVHVASPETRMECLFRHIRNSLAHGQTYYFENNNLMLEDKEGDKITARILIPTRALIEWIAIISNRRDN